MAFEALKIVRDVESMDRTMRLQLKLTPRRAILAIRTRVFTFRSFAFCFSVLSSCFSSTCSSLNVGLKGLMKRPGVPGGFKALFRGDAGVRGTSTPTYEECFEAWLSAT